MRQATARKMQFAARPRRVTKLRAVPRGERMSAYVRELAIVALRQEPNEVLSVSRLYSVVRGRIKRPMRRDYMLVSLLHDPLERFNFGVSTKGRGGLEVSLDE